MTTDHLLRQGLFVLFFGMLAMSSCISHRQLLMLEDGPKFTTDSIARFLNMPPILIQPDDRLMVRVSTFDEEMEARFNIPVFGFGGGGVGGGGGLGQMGNQVGNPMMNNMMGSLVDNGGNIELPVIGTVKLGGMTVEEAKAKLYKVYSEYLVNYSVDVIFLNKRVTVTGEVGRPGIVQMERNRMSLLEAIQNAQGITPFSNTEEVLVIREIQGERIYGTLNLKDRNIVNSQFFYVYPNDIIYIQPVKQKTFTTQASLFTSVNIITSVISAAALIIAFTR